MANHNYRISGELINTDRAMNETFWIGVYPGLSEIEISWMIDSIHQFVLTHGKN